jgi:REP element-mobilizing transposase RayT
MPLPIVIAHHLIFSAYGWWLPNDPRGSMSHRIRDEIIATLGERHYGRKTIQPHSTMIREFYENATGILKHELLEITSPDASVIADAFAGTIADRRYTCYACAIMPDHVHILIRKHRDQAEDMIAELQESSAEALREASRRTMEHPVWGGPGWKVFLDHPDAIRRIIRYIEENPVKIGRPRQTWPFVSDYDGWPLHPGHNLNSPYARRLRGR